MISRIWHGWTAAENASAYEGLLHRGRALGAVVRAVFVEEL